uniref:ribosomal protein S4 n=1 Tax=Eisenia bicyclis TaxID=6395 RepID=UPI002E7653F6|nr:ribosomal protein S4 [Eisenia bicyclis]WBP70082.1 ribosomal protein S4 [Eisenia bicyclis]
MRFKHRYKSCLWSRTDIWGDLLSKEKTFLRPKWDSIIGVLSSQKRRHRPLANIGRYRYPLCHDYNFLKPRVRPNQIFKYNRISYRNTLSLLMCVKRFYGDLSNKSFKIFCKRLVFGKIPSKKFIEVFEGRLDICLYRLGFFHSIYYSRQAILHSQVLVNGKKIDYGGFILQKGDYVEFCPSQRNAIRIRLVARYKRFRSFYIKLERWRLSNRFKFDLHLHPTPKWIHTDYSNLSFFISADVCTPVFYPFRVDIDEAIWASKYGYL